MEGMNIEKDLVTLESDIIMANTTAVIKFAFFFHPRFSFINIHEGEAISLTPFYLFLPLHRNQGISRAITAESSLLHIRSSRTRIGNFYMPSASR